MGNYTIFLKFENPRRSTQARIFSENDPKILDLKSSSEQIIFRKLSLGAPVRNKPRIKTGSRSDVILVPGAETQSHNTDPEYKFVNCQN